MQKTNTQKMIGGLLVIWLIIFVTYLMVKRMYENFKYKRIPGPPGLPILGNALSLWGKPEGKKKIALIMYHNLA